MTGASLLDHLDAPIVVGDPEGNVIYANPAFAERFGKTGGEVVSVPFASLFAGGGREAVLTAIARSCDTGETVHFRMREDGDGYRGVASPIEAETESVGVIMMFSDEPLADQRAVALHRDMQEPLDEVRQCFDELFEQTGGRRGERYRSAVEKGMAALDIACKWSDELYGLITGDGALSSGDQRLEPVKVCRAAAGRLASDFERAAVKLEVLVPASLRGGMGDAAQLEAVLVRLLRDRMSLAARGSVVTLSAREVESDAGPALLISVIAPSNRRADSPTEAFSAGRDSIAALAGFEHIAIESAVGTTTTLRIAAAPAS